ncbi:uncharacterized protein F5891DRAFT_983632 [Suillus fuscotomentosus]|uniref:Uncharacterized protein n=1 Tax=Suillus fuscotomentosus TaxID=1912939 RepID=A0AAD4DYH9_9AGAM|nr:uncharacterized protein F5891DRAFT_983632 [Suillus fuscotomentosus]KAG1896287.1 hypothetical protein F5891DRAFT_983632 [Suillus fuscotomentosus]
MLPRWDDQQWDSSESAGDISGQSITWSGNQQVPESHSLLQAHLQWPENQQIQESYSLQAHSQWPGNLQLQESHSLPAHPSHNSDSGFVAHDDESRPGPSSWPQLQPGDAPLAYDESRPGPSSWPQLQPGDVPLAYDESRPGPSSWPQPQPGHAPLPHSRSGQSSSLMLFQHTQHTQHTSPILTPAATSDPEIYGNLPPSVPSQLPAPASIDTNTSSHHDAIIDKNRHSRLLNESHESWPTPGRSQGRRQKLTGIDRAERARVTSKAQPIQIIPWGKSAVISACQEEMKRALLKDTLLPMKVTITSLANSSWNTVMRRQTRDDLRIWATESRSKVSKLAPVVDEIHEALKRAVRIFAYYEFDLKFDYAAALDESHVAERQTRVEGLIANDAFLHATQHVEGVATSVPFSHPAVIAFAAYLLISAKIGTCYLC